MVKSEDVELSKTEVTFKQIWVQIYVVRLK
jgi:hypothetical protein